MLYAFIGIVIGAVAGLMTSKYIATSKGKKLIQLVEDAEHKAKKVFDEAQIKEKELLLKAKDKAVKILEDARLEEKRAIEELKKEKAVLAEREQTFGAKLLEIEDVRKEIETKITKLAYDHKKVEEMKLEESKKLEEVAGLSREDALVRITKLVEEQHEDTLMSRIRKLEEMESDEIDRKAKNIMAVAIQRLASSHVAETTTTNVELP
ncbi:DUF3552 domain-containing protein, partial [Patescibacteria group bacterium]|nr:DUF3552 domain-containing protein [Patescibacteria group bacterium]